MTFTVAVEPKPPDEQFAAEDIKLFHQECGGGAITSNEHWIPDAPYNERHLIGEMCWQLHCRRCHTNAFVRVSKDGTALLMKTGIDGESRKIQKRFDRDDDIEAISRI
jgi:hypothetical protein